MILFVTSILFLLLLLFITVFVLLYASGLFTEVSVQHKQPPVFINGATFAYKIHTGPYSEAGYLFTEAYAVNSRCVQCGIRSLKEKRPVDGAEEDVERSAIGSIVPPDAEDECVDAFVRAGFQIARLPQVSQALVASFPHVSFLSITIGSRRLYACMEAYVKENDLKVNTLLELYDGQFIHCVGLSEEDEPRFKQLIDPEVPSQEKATSSAVDADVTPEPDLELLVTHEQVETIPKPEQMLAAMVKPADQAVPNGDDDSDSLEDSFEKIAPETLPE